MLLDRDEIVAMNAGEALVVNLFKPVTPSHIYYEHSVDMLSLLTGKSGGSAHVCHAIFGKYSASIKESKL
ncbi:unnamed protein product [Gongylonema pulchrum]|uniref:ABC transporter ATP-binding protein n=1 Tax=Gongylonema pulchrum TaxID=637853 RepID=A0A183D2W9_9BILA|nr:unnamed protein product [Gongylonema pulchrum]